VITAVDASVLYDIFWNDPAFGVLSVAALRQCRNEGSLVVCDVVWAETSAGVNVPGELRRKLDAANIEFSATTVATAERAGTEWRRYRDRGGSRTRLIGDFLIAAHAMEQADRLLTRDRGFFRSYFPALVVVDPLDL